MSDIEYAHIALIEDDTQLANLTQTYLEKQGYRVTVIEDGQQAVDDIPMLQPDCVLLDIMLPGMDGMEVCRQVRKNYQGPIIFLTAKGDELDEILGLEVGGDDYLAKPVDPRRLLAHIRAHLRRTERLPAANLVNNSGKKRFVIQALTETVILDNVNLKLSQPEFRLMTLLINSTEAIISRDDVMLAVRGIEHDGYSRTVDILVSDLRKKLPDPEWIKTIRGKGYIWQGPR